MDFNFIILVLICCLVVFGACNIIANIQEQFNKYSNNIADYYIEEITLNDNIKIYKAYCKVRKKNKPVVDIYNNDKAYFKTLEDAKLMCLIYANFEFKTDRINIKTFYVNNKVKSIKEYIMY